MYINLSYINLLQFNIHYKYEGVRTDYGDLDKYELESDESD